jgi:hypothetical protein
MTSHRSAGPLSEEFAVIEALDRERLQSPLLEHRTPVGPDPPKEVRAGPDPPITGSTVFPK